jgi:hypothetical protein
MALKIESIVDGGMHAEEELGEGRPAEPNTNRLPLGQ